ncbi:MAG: class I SAM-dependent methyltransferase [Chromatiales bacterium]|nr:class I SAM-dependent methyltransferase [Chromatiales bacterium]
MNQDDKDIQSFFEGWQLYQQVIAGNYMLHNEITDQMRRALGGLLHVDMNVLEVGCGDAYVLSQALEGNEIAHYRGIDLSAPALEFARKNLDGRVRDIQLHADTMQRSADYADRPYHLIVAGYSMHHLENDEKRELLAWMHDQLTDDGEIFVYDVFRRDDETREQFLERSVRCFRDQWADLSEDQLSRVSAHVLNQDHPESIPSWEAIAARAGFADCMWTFRDPYDLYAVVRMR